MIVEMNERVGWLDEIQVQSRCMFRPIRQIFPLANRSTDMPNCQLGE